MLPLSKLHSYITFAEVPVEVLVNATERGVQPPVLSTVKSALGCAKTGTDSSTDNTINKILTDPGVLGTSI